MQDSAGRNIRRRQVFWPTMTKRTLAAGILALALLATPRLASAGVHFSLGIGLPLFGAVVAPAPAVVVPAPAYALPPAYYPYPYPPAVAYGPPGYYGGSVVVWGHHYRDRYRDHRWHGGWQRWHR
jgi:hypothetical protein